MNVYPRPDETDWAVGTIFTVGHSTLPIEQFIGLLRIYGVEQLADVRTVPRSRHNPQFNAGDLAVSLDAAGIFYLSMPTLGGLRHPHRNSVNSGWRNKSFRGYADYMQTAAFQEAVDALVRVGQYKRTAIMCAESVPWRCHRSLIADALEVRRVSVIEILSETRWRVHKLTPFASVEGTSITYPAAQSRLL